VDISRLPVTVNGRTLDDPAARRPAPAPSSIYLTALRNGDVVVIGALPDGLRATNFTTPRVYSEDDKEPARRGPFTMVPLAGDVALPQDWNDLDSFAGLVPGEHWVFGVPYRQKERAAMRAVPAEIPGGRAVFAAYAPQGETAPQLILADGRTLPLTGRPAAAWRAWPPIFHRDILLDMAMVPPGTTVKAVDPNGAWLMALTVFDGDAGTLAAASNALAAAAADAQDERRDRERMAALRTNFARLPEGKIALLPNPAGGPGANFAARTGLRQKWVRLGPRDFISPATFNAAKFPVAFFIGSEHYLRTVQEEGDGDAALKRYLKEGGTLVLLASGPYPLYYGDRVGAESGRATPLLPELGLPLTVEDAPEGARIEAAAGQTILHSVPSRFAFPPGDPRVRAGQPSRYGAADRYQALLSVVDGQGRSHGDVAFYVELGSGPGQGGKVLCVWSTLLSSPQGGAIMGDAVSWVLEKALRER